MTPSTMNPRTFAALQAVQRAALNAAQSGHQRPAALKVLDDLARLGIMPPSAKA